MDRSRSVAGVHGKIWPQGGALDLAHQLRSLVDQPLKPLATLDLTRETALNFALNFGIESHLLAFAKTVRKIPDGIAEKHGEPCGRP
jgi:hypothetical protein